MTAESTSFSLDEPKAYQGILWGGLIAGVLDITAAFVNSSFQARSPMWVLQSIASGVLGTDSYKGGLLTAALGGALHFLIAFVAATVYYGASRKFKFLIQRPFVCGVLYGVAVYLFMYLIVLPLTFQRSFFHPFTAVVKGLLIHIFCVGLPIALTIRRFSGIKHTVIGMNSR